MWQSNAAHNYRSGFLLSLTAAAHATVVHVSSSFHLTGKKTGQTRGGGKEEERNACILVTFVSCFTIKGEKESEGTQEEWLHFNRSLYSTGPSSKYEAHLQPNHLRITGLMAFSAPVACKILGVSLRKKRIN